MENELHLRNVNKNSVKLSQKSSLRFLTLFLFFDMPLFSFRALGRLMARTAIELRSFVTIGCRSIVSYFVELLFINSRWDAELLGVAVNLFRAIFRWHADYVDEHSRADYKFVG